MNRYRCRVITCYQFGLTAYLCVFFIATDHIPDLLCRGHQYLCGTSCEDCRAINYYPHPFWFSCFPLVYFVGEVIPRNFIYYLSFVDNQTKAIQVFVKQLELLVIRFASCLLFAIFPYCTSIRNIIDSINAYEITKTSTVFIWYSVYSPLNTYNRCTNITWNINTESMVRLPVLLLRSAICNLLLRMG